MKSSRLILLSLIWNACANCCAYDISQPPKSGPSPLPDDPTSNTKRRKPWLDLSRTTNGKPTRRRTLVLVSTFCSGAVGACVSSALVPQQQNLARQWLPVSAAGTLLLVAAAVEGEWVGHAHQWWRQQQQNKRRRQHRVPEVSEVIDENFTPGKRWPSDTTSSRRDDVHARTSTTAVHNAESATVAEIEPAGGIIYGGYPIQQEQPKRDASLLGSEGSKASSASNSAGNGWTFPTNGSYSSSSSSFSASNVGGSTSTANADTSSTTTRSEDNKSHHGSVVSSDGSSEETTRQPKPNHVVADQAPVRHSLVNRQPKKSHRNLLLFWKKKKQEKKETDGKPPIPPWSHFAQEDNSRPYEEDYGDDSIGEGLGL
jgi:hypothetical protein